MRARRRVALRTRSRRGRGEQERAPGTRPRGWTRGDDVAADKAGRGRGGGAGRPRGVLARMMQRRGTGSGSGRVSRLRKRPRDGRHRSLSPWQMTGGVVADAPTRGGREKGSGDRRRGTRSREMTAVGGALLPRTRPPPAAGRGSRDPPCCARRGTSPWTRYWEGRARRGRRRAPSERRSRTVLADALAAGGPRKGRPPPSGPSR